MVDHSTMLEAHVRFELEQWSGDQLTRTLAAEVSALFDWLATIPVAELPGFDDLAGLVLDELVAPPVSDALLEQIQHLARSAREALVQADPKVNDVLRKEDYDQFAAAVIRMRPIREAIIEQVTTSELYSQLISHVLYRGIKNYLLSESPIARRVPGVSSLMRMGQGALNSAVPNLEKSIDNQLTGFVNSNVQDAIRESQQYLDTVLDDDLLAQVADEIWRANSEASIASATELVSDESVSELVDAGREFWANLRQEPLVREVVSDMAADLQERYRGRSVAAVLEDLGVTEQTATERLAKTAEPWFRRAAADGFLEGRIRARLEPFYASYHPGTD